MKEQIKGYWLEGLRNLVISILLFAVLMAVLLLFRVPIVYGAIFTCSMIASVIGVAYVLTIRNPQNYTGFYLGIISSAFLGIQFFLMGSYDLTFLYFIVFIPFQIASIIKWLKPVEEDAKPFMPSFLSGSQRLWVILLFIAIVILDYFLITYWLDPFASVSMKIISGILIASSLLANFLLIHKKIDSWICWIIYSLDGLLLAVLIENQFNILLFSIFLIINALTAISWLRAYKKG